jgi:hypothetical protein
MQHCQLVIMAFSLILSLPVNSSGNTENPEESLQN